MADKEKWITLKSGKKVKLDKDGNIIAGFQGFMGKHISKIKDTETKILKPYSKPTKSFTEYLNENSGNRKEAAKQFFKENLQDKYVNTTINGQPADIHFTGTSWRKIKMNIENDPIKANFLEDVPNVLQHYKGNGKLTKERNDFSEFHYFEKAVEKTVNGIPVKAKVKVDVGARKGAENENEAYSYVTKNIAQDNKKSHVERLKEFKPNGTPSHFSNMAFDKTIPLQGEVVNIDILVLEKAMLQEVAIDIDTIKRELIEEMNAVNLAVHEVAPLVGELDAVAFDSAEDVYLKACQLMNVTASKKSARDVYKALYMVKTKAFQSRFDR